MISDVRYQCASKLSQCGPSLSKCTRKVTHGVPTFSGTYCSSISQLQALATGIGNIQILIFHRFTLSSGTWYGVSRYTRWCLKMPEYGVHWDIFLKIWFVKSLRLCISENVHLLLKYTPTGCFIHMCRQNVLFRKLNICFGRFELFRLKVPQSPLPHKLGRWL